MIRKTLLCLGLSVASLFLLSNCNDSRTVLELDFKEDTALPSIDFEFKIVDDLEFAENDPIVKDAPKKLFKNELDCNVYVAHSLDSTLTTGGRR